MANLMEYMRARISFCLFKSVLISLRGIRGRRSNTTIAISDVSFNLIPNMPEYDGH